MYCNPTCSQNRFRSSISGIAFGVLVFPLSITAGSVAFGQSPTSGGTSTQEKGASPEKPADQAKTQEESMDARVIKVIDGDSIKVKDEAGKEYEIQIEGTDAPEIKQAHGKESLQALIAMVKDRDVRLTWEKKDAFDRLLAQVYVGDKHVNSRMIQDGHAWHFKRYNQSKVLADLEVEAREAKRGLWSSKEPQAPWDFRKENRTPDKPDR